MVKIHLERKQKKFREENPDYAAAEVASESEKERGIKMIEANLPRGVGSFGDLVRRNIALDRKHREAVEQEGEEVEDESTTMKALVDGALEGTHLSLIIYAVVI